MKKTEDACYWKIHIGGETFNHVYVSVLNPNSTIVKVIADSATTLITVLDLIYDSVPFDIEEPPKINFSIGRYQTFYEESIVILYRTVNRLLEYRVVKNYIGGSKATTLWHPALGRIEKIKMIKRSEN